MGYYSNLTLDIDECNDKRMMQEWEMSAPTREQILKDRLFDLEMRLEELEGKLPRDPLCPEYDRYFYEDCIMHYYEDSDEDAQCEYTIQGLLRAIDEVKEELEKLQGQRIEQLRFYMLISLTGADSNGQCVLVDAFDPPEDDVVTFVA